MSSGKVVQVIGAVIDVEFPRDNVPQVYDALSVSEKGLTLEVQQQLGDGVVRAIAMGSSEGISRGLSVENTGAPISVPVGIETLGRIMDVLGNPIDEKGPIGEQQRSAIHRAAPAYDELAASEEVLETGIKVIDLVCPFAKDCVKFCYAQKGAYNFGNVKPLFEKRYNLTKSNVFVDTYQGGLKESGDIVIPLQKGIISENSIKADLFELCSGKKQGRQNELEITFFKSVGHALEDLTAATYYYKKFKNE